MAQSAPSTLPLELEREIFEQAAYTDPLCVPKLMLVAWRVKIWVEPFLYRILMLGSTMDPKETGYPFVDDRHCTRALSIPPHVLKSSVRDLWMDFLPPHVAESLLSAASGIDNLYVTMSSDSPHSLLHAIASLSPKRLHTYFHDLLALPDATTLPIFSRLTHLEIMETESENHAEIWRVVGEIRPLTHLAFHEDDSDFLTLCSTLLAASTDLRVLLFKTDSHDFHDAKDFPVLGDLRKDLRFVQMRHENPVRDWRLGALSGVDLWSRAEDFIAKRHSGEIDRFQYIIQDDASMKSQQ